ncbi:MAG: hypothetical protein HZB13_11840 [Acidobacteria bacterium]|nr:hypothetical protein [Acidobacteriota bacterium]
MKLTAILLAGITSFAGAVAAGPPQDAARLFFSRSFPGSKPAYMEIRLTRDGKTQYREAPDEADPILFKLSAEETETVFTLADKLDHFKRNLESGLKVARMGDKTFGWESGAEKHQTTFNYSLDTDAQALHDWFERMCESAYYYIELERAAKYDKLGVNAAILRLEAAWDRKRLVGLDQYLPLLDRVARNESYLNMARERAQKLAEAFRAAAAAPKPEGETKAQ